MRWGWAALVVTGCGRFGFTPGDTDPTGDANAGADGGAPDATCTWGPWENPTLVVELDSEFEDSAPVLRTDGLEIVFARDLIADGPADLFHATRTSASEPFDPPEPLAMLNTVEDDDNPSLSRDGLTLYYDTQGAGPRRLMRATRATTDQPFDNPVVVPSTITMPGSPSISGDGLSLFQTDTFGNIYVADRPAEADPFGTAVLLPGPIESASWQEGPEISGSSLLFIQDVGGIFEILVSTRTGTTYSAPAQIPILAGVDNEWDPALAADGATLYFVRFDGMYQDILQVTRSCE